MNSIIKIPLKTYRYLTHPIRAMPDFIIIGVQRAGTTSLYNYLVEHPNVVPAFKKEIHFFDINFKKGIGWYRAHFPILKFKKGKSITGAASPYYIFHPRAPERIYKTIPQVKLIVLLRNPVDRAYSHYCRELRNGREHLSFEEAIKKENERLGGEEEKMIKNENYQSFNHRHYSYLTRGLYINQLRSWMKLFPEDYFLIIKSEDLSINPSVVFQKVLDFLKLPKWEPIEYKKYHCGHYPKMNSETREHLLSYFEPYNERLYKFLGRNFEWEKH